jgi:hypothetical protein
VGWRIFLSFLGRWRLRSVLRVLRRLRSLSGRRFRRLLCIREGRYITGFPLAAGISLTPRALALLNRLLGVLRVRIDRADILFRLTVAGTLLVSSRILDSFDARTRLRDCAGDQQANGRGAEKKICSHLCLL